MPKKHLTNIIAHNPEIQHIKGPDLNTMYFNLLLNSLILHLFTNSNPFIIYLRPYEYGMILKSVNPMRMKTNYIPFDSNTSHWTFEVARDFVFVISNEYNAVAARAKFNFLIRYLDVLRVAWTGTVWCQLLFDSVFDSNQLWQEVCYFQDFLLNWKKTSEFHYDCR